ncbi:hypothetical protein E3E11_02200 [Oecophyllibacter saccharovorans]|uniref:5-methylcytosine restriction system specificity protein McrC n=1 Tax=Oecophyllibacter saccharovorans TaxID=2558360 RepID=UPI001144A2E7|nr:hypothetical protein [Oecophyllibacter saccharovorans]QDH14866.1 hypothetical protein E3E11_02200 [Oecophyllibacter saccharovorans]
MTIPVRNIYYMLLYAWGLFREINPATSEQETGAFTHGNSLPVLVASVLARVTRQQLQSALAGGYGPQHAGLSAPRGRIDLAAVVRKGGARESLPCVFDVYSSDTLLNRLLLGTLLQLTETPELPAPLRRELAGLAAQFSALTPLAPQPQLFDQLPPLPVSSRYPLLMALCRFWAEQRQPLENGRGFRFPIPDRTRMSAVFEKFLGNFYRHEMQDILTDVGARRLKWPLTGPDAEDLLPDMLTDLVLRSGERTLIIEAKFFRRIFRTHFAASSATGEETLTGKLNSAHLYQLASYRQAWEQAGNGRADAALLYALPGPATPGPEALSVGTGEFSHRFRWKGQEPDSDKDPYLFVHALSLAQPWQAIDARLRNLVGDWLAS